MDKKELLKMYHENPNFVILFDSLEKPLMSNQFHFTNSQKKYQIEGLLQNEIKLRISNLIEKSVKENFTFFNDEIARLNSWKYSNDILQLEFSTTHYFDFATLNMSLDDKIKSIDADKTLREYLSENPHDLARSILPNPLSINLSVLLKNESKIVISKHSSKNFEATDQLTTPIGGTVSITENDIDDNGVPDPFKTAIREAKEELGIDIKSDKICFFGLGRDLKNLKPQLFGAIDLDISSNELLESLRTTKDSDETEKIFFYKFTSEDLKDVLLSKNWSEVGRAAIIASVLANNLSDST